MEIIMVDKVTLHELIDNYTAAKVEESWAGHRDPEDYDAIMQDLSDATVALDRFIDNLPS